MQLTDELAESQFPGCGGADGLRRELLKVEAADREGRQTKRVQVLRRFTPAACFCSPGVLAVLSGVKFVDLVPDA